MMLCQCRAVTFCARARVVSCARAACCICRNVTNTQDIYSLQSILHRVKSHLNENKQCHRQNKCSTCCQYCCTSRLHLQEEKSTFYTDAVLAITYTVSSNLCVLNKEKQQSNQQHKCRIIGLCDRTRPSCCRLHLQELDSVFKCLQSFSPKSSPQEG